MARAILSLVKILTIFVTLTVGAQGVSVNLPVWEQTSTLSEYIYYRGVPELTQFTMCMWWKGTNPTRTADYPISVSNQATANEIMVYFPNNDQLYAYLYPNSYATTACDNTELNNIMLNWNKHCFTWASAGTFRWWVTYNDPDTLEVYRSVGTNAHTLRPSMNVILFQEQDSEMGSFDINQVTEAKVAWYNFWDYELTSAQLNALTCESVGNIFTITDMSFYGPGHFTYTESFECGEVKKGLSSSYTVRSQQKTLCKVTGAKLSNHILTTVTTNTPALCVARCSANSDCMSANYNLDDGACDLNSIEGRGYVGADDFADNSASNFLYFSSLEC